MRLGGAGGRLIELGERERGEQVVAARALLLRDGYGRPVCVFSEGGTAGIALEEDVATQTMQERKIAMRFAFIGEG